jgi:hypothetical protein
VAERMGRPGDRTAPGHQAADRLERERASASTPLISPYALLGAKTMQSIRVVGNLGVGILADPTVGNRQNDCPHLRRVAGPCVDATGRSSSASSTGACRHGRQRVSRRHETRGLLKLGARYTRGTVRLDAGVAVGLTDAWIPPSASPEA